MTELWTGSWIYAFLVRAVETTGRGAGCLAASSAGNLELETDANPDICIRG